jgi:hypothetical protein
MRSCWICASFVVVVMMGCTKSDSGPSSAEGSWTYTTPDAKVAVTFQLVKTASGSLAIQNQTYKLSGTSYESAAVISGVALPAIATIKINANDAKLTYPYYILFTNIKVSSDFKRMDVADGEYSTPTATTSLKAVTITRP